MRIKLGGTYTTRNGFEFRCVEVNRDKDVAWMINANDANDGDSAWRLDGRSYVGTQWDIVE